MRLKSAHLTREKECSSWPTPDASIEKFRLGGNSQQSKSLEATGRRGELGLPAPEKLNKSGKSQELRGTPTATSRPPRSEETMAKCLKFRKSKGKNSVPLYLGEQAGGRLNPNWVEQLMGLPAGWTQLPAHWLTG